VTDENQENSPDAKANKKIRKHKEELGDFTTTLRVVPISCLAMVIGVLCALVALVLLRLIGLFTNLFYSLHVNHPHKQRLLPVVDAQGKLVGVLTRADIRERIEREGDGVLQRSLGDLVRASTVETNPDEILRVVVYRMAEKGVTRLPVVEHSTGKFLGLISLDDLLKARARHFEEERRREQTLNLKFPLPGRRVAAKTETPTAR